MDLFRCLPGQCGRAGAQPYPNRLASDLPGRTRFACGRPACIRTGRTHLSSLITVILLAGLAGCAGPAAANVGLPAKPSPASSVSATTGAALTSRRVLAAYDGYWQAASQAVDSRSAPSARAILASYVSASIIPALVRASKVLWARDEISYGSAVSHVMSVKFTGRGTAAVHDCLDLSHSGLQNARTGQLVGSLGQSHLFMITTLVLAHQRWLVTNQIPVMMSCAY